MMINDMRANSEEHRLKYTLLKRCSLRRNFDAFPFTPALTTDSSMMVVEAVLPLLKQMNTQGSYQWQLELSQRERLTQTYLNGYLQTDPTKSNIEMQLFEDHSRGLQMVVNDREHVRLMAESALRSVESLWRELDQVDDYISVRMKPAFHKKYGFLTSDLQYVGTGLSMEAICHLPALQTTGFIDSITEAMKGIGISIQKKWENFYSIKNMHTIGKSEFEMVLLMSQVLERLEEKESAGRATLLESQYTALKDQCLRAYGILSYVQIIEFDESVQLLSSVWMGADYGWLGTNREDFDAYNCLMKLTSASMKSLTQSMSFKEHAQRRAELIRLYLRDFEVKE